jgi:hypothetical protein
LFFLEGVGGFGPRGDEAVGGDVADGAAGADEADEAAGTKAKVYIYRATSPHSPQLAS